MSPERVRLARPPASAHYVPGGLESAFEPLLEREREQAAAQGAAHAWERGAALLAAAAERLDAAREGAAGELSSAAVQLAVEIARELLRAEIKAERHDVERSVRDALAAAGAGRAPCQVHLHPDDARRLEPAAFRAGTEIVPDVGVPRGSVQIGTSQGLLVADLDEALAAIAARLQQELS